MIFMVTQHDKLRHVVSEVSLTFFTFLEFTLVFDKAKCKHLPVCLFSKPEDQRRICSLLILLLI
jgi:hypothetical protein